VFDDQDFQRHKSLRSGQPASKDKAFSKESSDRHSQRSVNFENANGGNEPRQFSKKSSSSGFSDVSKDAPEPHVAIGSQNHLALPSGQLSRSSFTSNHSAGSRGSAVSAFSDVSNDSDNAKGAGSDGSAGAVASCSLSFAQQRTVGAPEEASRPAVSRSVSNSPQPEAQLVRARSKESSKSGFSDVSAASSAKEPQSARQTPEWTAGAEPECGESQHPAGFIVAWQE